MIREQSPDGRRAPKTLARQLDITLEELLQSLVGFTARIEGGPKWVQSERYDIVATTGGTVSAKDRVAMIQRLLKDRFKLEFHENSVEEKGLALTVAMGR